MKRLLLILGILLLLVGQGWAATYYVNTTTGANGNAGTSAGTAWKNTQYALGMLANGDTLNIVAPATTPSRSGYVTASSAKFTTNASTGLTIQGTSTSDRAYLMASHDVSNGAAVDSGATAGNLLINGDFEGWLTATTLWNFTFSGTAGATISQNTTTPHAGLKALQIIRASGTPVMYCDVYLPALTPMVLTFYHKATGAAKPIFDVIERDPVPDNYLQDNGTWSDVANDIDTTHHDDWGLETLSFTTNGAGVYRIQFAWTASATYGLDDLVLVPATATHAWDVDSGTIYKLSTNFVTPVMTFTKCTAATWTASGATALQYVPKAADYASLAAGTWFWDDTAKMLYYMLASGENITTLHFEAGMGSGYSGFNVTSASNTLQYLNLYGGNNQGFNVSGNSNTFNDCSSKFAYSCNYYLAGTGEIANRCYGAFTFNEDNYEVGGGDSTLNWCHGEYAKDDGFMAIVTGQMTCNYCLANDNGLELATNNSGFAIESANAKMHLNNCLAINNYGNSYQIAANTNWSMYNCIGYGSVSGVDAYADSVANFNKTLGHTNNIFGSKHANWTLSTDESLADPKLVNAAGGNYHLLGGSPAWKTGAVLAGMTVDYAGVTVGSPPNMGIYEGVISGGGTSLGLGLSGGNYNPRTQ